MKSSTLRDRTRATAERLRSGFPGACVHRAVEMDAVQRAIVLASQAFTAGIPLAIIFSALTPGSRDLVQRLITRFHLTGSTAHQVRSLFLSGEDIKGAATWIGVVFLIGSALSLSASLQTMYERATIVAHIGLRNRWRTIIWLLLTCAYIEWFVALKLNVYDGGTNIARAVLSTAGSYAYWLLTPRLLLGPRQSWRRFVPIAGFTTIAVTLLELASPLYMPQMIRDDAARFGMTGVAFALMSWLAVLAFLIVGSTVIATELGRRRLNIVARARAPAPPPDG
jgi:membrane protein